MTLARIIIGEIHLRDSVLFPRVILVLFLFNFASLQTGMEDLPPVGQASVCDRCVGLRRVSV